MASTARVRARLLARLAAPLLLAAGLNACSTIPDWVDPTTWVGGGSQTSSDQTSDAAAGTAQPADAGQTPDIASIPPKPAPPSTAEEQKQVADSLEADRAQAHYSADALRGGTEAAAPPPSAETAPPGDAVVSSSTTTIPAADQTASSPPSSPQADQATASAPATPPADVTATSSDTSMASSAAAGSTTAAASDEGAAASQPAQPPETPAPAPADTAAAAPSTPAPAQVASTDSASAAAPAAAPLAAPEAAAAPAASAADMQGGFAPSRAPALDPSVAHFVPEQILSRYQETATAAATPGVTGEPAIAPAKHRHHKKARTSQLRLRRRHLASNHWGRLSLRAARNNRDAMRREQAAFNSSRSAIIPVSYSPQTAASPRAMDGAPSGGSADVLDPSLFAPRSGPAVAVVEFPQETTILDHPAKNRVQVAARAFAAQGGAGYVRVVGHSSGPPLDPSRTARPGFNFERSEAQATAVARELIRDGVPADRVLVEAVGDSPPVDRAALQKSGRRAEIYLQS